MSMLNWQTPIKSAQLKYKLKHGINGFVAHSVLFGHYFLFSHKYESKHRKNCECCPVSLLIVRSQRIVRVSNV